MLGSAILEAIYKIEGDEVFQILRPMLGKTFKGEIVNTLLSIIARIDKPDPIIALVNNVDNSDPELRMIAISGLSQRMDKIPEIANLIIVQLAKEKDNRVKLACINALGLSKEPAAKEAIKNFIASPDLELSRAAVGSLGNDLDRESMRMIVPMLNDATWARKWIAAVSLSRHIDINPQFREPIAKILAGGDLDTKIGILSGLIQSNIVAAVKMVKPYLEDEEPAVRRAAIAGLTQITKDDITPWIKPLIKDPDWQVRLSALQAVDYKEYKEMDRQLFESIKDLARRDINHVVQSKAL